MIEVPSRSEGNKKKPQACVDYIDVMGGVDLSDQCIVTYSAARKRMKKYYQKIFRHMLDVTVFNAFIVQKKQGGVLTQLEFRMNLIENIFLKYGKSTADKEERLKERKSGSQSPGRLIGRHFAEHNPPTQKRKHGVKRCVVCLAKGQRRETILLCTVCDAPFLCSAMLPNVPHKIELLTKSDFFIF